MLWSRKKLEEYLRQRDMELLGHMQKMIELNQQREETRRKVSNVLQRKKHPIYEDVNIIDINADRR